MDYSDFSEFFAEAIIRKEGGKYILYSHKGKKLGTFSSEEEAKKREKQINYFKYLDKHPKGSLLTYLDFQEITEKYFGRHIS